MAKKKAGRTRVAKASAVVGSDSSVQKPVAIASAIVETTSVGKTPPPSSSSKKRTRATTSKLSCPKAKAPSGYKYRAYHKRAVDIFCSNPSFNTHDVHDQLVKEGADVSFRCIDAWSKKYAWHELREKTALSKQKILARVNDLLDKPNLNSQDIFAAKGLLESAANLIDDNPDKDTSDCPEGDIIVKLNWLIDSYLNKLKTEKNPTMVQLILAIIAAATKLLQQHKEYMTDIITKVSSSYFAIIEEYAKKYNKPLLKEWVESVEDISNMIDTILLDPLK
jgi:hypothetical protein